MRKKGLLVSSLASVLLLAACSDDGKYEKLIAKADKAMENLEVEKAIEHYEKILELDPTSFSYGVSRLRIVEELLDDANVMSDRMEYLQEVVDNAKEMGEDIKFSAENASEIINAYNVIQSALIELEEYPATKMYKELADLENHFAKETDKKVIAPLIKETDKKIEELKFDEAEEKVNVLNDLSKYFSATVSEESIQKYYDLIESQKERYIVMPRTYVKHEHVLYDGGDVGKITFLGESLSYNNDGYKEIYFKVDGDLQHIIGDLEIDSRYILSDGSAETRSSFDTSTYGEYTILSQSLNIGEEISIVRYDYQLNILNLSDYKSIKLKTVEDKGELPALLKVEEDKTLKTDLKIEDSEKAIHITKMIVDPEYIKFQGTITSKKDVTFENKSYFLVPNFNTVASTEFHDTLYAGVGKEFELTYQPDKYLNTEMPYGHFILFDQTFNLDLKTGKEVKGVTSDIVDTIAYTDTGVRYYEDLYDSSLFTDVAGKVYGNVAAVTPSSSDREPLQWHYKLNEKYATFKVDVGVLKERSTENFGSSTVTFLGDGNALKTVKLDAGAATTTVELDVKNVKELLVKVEMVEGNEGNQIVLFGNGTMIAK